MITVCLLIKSKDNRQLFKEVFVDQFNVIEAADTIPDEPVDLFITDHLMIENLQMQLMGIKNRNPEIYLPVLLFTTQFEPDLPTSKWWDIIDDVIMLPLEKTIVDMKIKVHMRSRNHSALLVKKNEELYEIQSQLEIGMKAGKVSFIELDTQSGKIELSKEWKKYLNCKIPTISDEEEFFNHIHPDDLESVKNELQKVISHEKDELYITCRFKCNGQYSWFQIRSALKTADNRNAKKFLISLIDITEQKQCEIECLKREKTLQETNRIIVERNNEIEHERRILNSILETMPLGLVYFNNNGKVAMLSKHFKENFGDFTGQDGYDIAIRSGVHLPDTEFDKTKLPIFRMMEKREILQNQEVIVENVGGKKIYTQASTAPVLNEEGKIEGGVLIFVDITQHKKLQQDLRSERELLQSLIDSIPVMVKISNKKEINVNRTFEKITGWTNDDARDNNLMELVYPDPENRKNVARFMKAASEEFRKFSMKTKSGGTVESSWSFIRIPDGREVGIGIDITERERAEAAIKESEERFHTLADNISQLAWMADPEGNIFWYNKRWYDFTGTNYEIMQKDGVKRVIHSDHLAHVMSSFQKALQTGEPWEHTFLMLREDGVYCWFLTRAMPIRNEDGKIIRWFGTNTDVTEIRNLQEQVKHEREVLQTVFDGIPVMLILYDPSQLTLQVNRFFRGTTKWTNDDLNGPGNIVKLFSEPEFNKKAFLFLQTFQGYRDYIIQSKDGEKIESSWANVKLPDGRMVAIGLDIRDRKMVEQELRIAAQRFQRICSSRIIGVVLAGPNGEIYFANDAFLELVGYSRKDIINISWIDITPQEYNQLDNKAVEEIKTRGVATPFEKEFIRKDGSRVWVLLAATLLPGPQKHIFTFVLNVTDRKKAMADALHKRAEIEAILNSLPDGYIIYDQDGSIRQMNERAREMTGITEIDSKKPFEERIKKLSVLTTDKKVFPLDQIPSYRALHGEMVRDVIMNINNNENSYWISVSASPISTNGKPIGAIMEFSDITKLRILQEQLADERNFTNAILQVSGALIAVLDKDSNFVRFNKACEVLSGYTAEEVRGKSIYDLFIPDEEKMRVKKEGDKLLSHIPLVEVECHWRTKTGEMRFIRWRVTLLKDESKKMYYAIATGIDITDRKRLQEELSISNRDMESFSYSISHDLRGPLGVVKGIVEVLNEEYSEKLGREGLEYLNLINTSVDKMQQLISSLLNLSRVGSQALNLEDVNLSEMVRNYLAELEKREPDRSVESIVEQNVHIQADSNLIRVAIENLLRNAWKFSSKRDLTRIEFGVKNLSGKKTYYIKDNGAGFDMKVAKRIFEPFKRGHKDKDFSGSGIGLSIVSKAIKRHGGIIWAEGEEDKGATFYFTLD